MIAKLHFGVEPFGFQIRADRHVVYVIEKVSRYRIPDKTEHLDLYMTKVYRNCFLLDLFLLK